MKTKWSLDTKPPMIVNNYPQNWINYRALMCYTNLKCRCFQETLGLVSVYSQVLQAFFGGRQLLLIPSPTTQEGPTLKRWPDGSFKTKKRVSKRWVSKLFFACDFMEFPMKLFRGANVCLGIGKPKEKMLFQYPTFKWHCRHETKKLDSQCLPFAFINAQP